MTMFRSKEALTELGAYDLAERQADILTEFQRRYPGMKDISLTEELPQLQTARPEIALAPLSPETRKLVEHMKDNGYAVYDTTGRTPASLKQEGMRYLVLSSELAERTASSAL